MTKAKQTKQEKKKENPAEIIANAEIARRGRIFEGTVTKKFPKRVVIEFERTVYVQKYERFYKKKTRLHARLPDLMAGEVNVGDYIQIQETRPLSKIIHFIVTKVIRKSGEKTK
jgi:small subunit ribosomal protein S17